jgi:Na+/H+-dicarboxylate symporter
MFALAISDVVFPAWMTGSLNELADAHKFPAYFVIKIPPVLDVTTALVTAFMFGLGMEAVNAEPLRRAFNSLRDVVSLAIKKAVMPLLPAYIMVVIADLTASGRLMSIGGECLKIMGLAMAVTTMVLLIQYVVAGMIAGRNPFKALWNMLPAYLTGWGCCSSAATIPVSLRQVRENGVSDETADLVVPLCANVHLAGSMANMVVYTAGFLVLAGQPITLGAYAEFILMVSIVAVASPGIPGGVVLASAAIAETTLGFTPERYALVIATYMALDGMGTACNLTGDGAIALIVDRFRKRMTAKDSRQCG